MKNKIFNFAILLLLLCNDAFSQTKSIGFSAGYSFSKFFTGKELTSQGLDKPIFNSFYENQFKKHLALNIGVSFYTAGDKENTRDINNKPINLSWSYNYISLPIALKYSFGNKLKPYAKLGAYASYLLKAEGLPFNQIRDINTIKNVDLKSDTKSFDYGILFGAGLEYKINKQFAVFAETNAIYGLPKFDNNSQNKQHYVSAELGLKYYLPSSIKK